MELISELFLENSVRKRLEIVRPVSWDTFKSHEFKFIVKFVDVNASIVLNEEFNSTN